MGAPAAPATAPVVTRDAPEQARHSRYLDILRASILPTVTLPPLEWLPEDIGLLERQGMNARGEIRNRLA
jgi:hypothetical protein